MLRALYERGIAPDLIVGTSAGALNGAFISSRPQTVETADELADVWSGLRRGQVVPAEPADRRCSASSAPATTSSPAPACAALIDAPHEPERLEEMPIPLHVVAVDVISGEELRLSRGRVAMRSWPAPRSPASWRPCAGSGRTLMDGGVANNTPISHAVDLGAQRIYVLPTGHACALQQPPRGALAMALHAISLLTQRRLIDDIERHRGQRRT